MQYTPNQGDTWNSVAAAYTIGGSAYGTGLATINGYQNASGTDALYPDINSITIPDNWLTPTAAGNASNFGISGDAWDTPGSTVTPVSMTTTSSPGGASPLSGVASGIGNLFKSPSGLLAVAIGAWFLLNKGGPGASAMDYDDSEEWEEAE